jgi:hypothetical protein
MKLTDTQRSLLEAAAMHPDKQLANFPANLRGGALAKVINAMLNASLIESSNQSPDMFQITTVGMQAIGATPQAKPSTREGTKQAVLIELLKRPEGATLPQMTEATGWQVHYADVLVMPTNVGNPAYVAEIAALGSA